MKLFVQTAYFKTNIAMKTFLCFCLLFCSMLGFSQSKYFEQNIGWYEIHNGWKIYEKPNGGYIVWGSNYQLEANTWNAYSLHLNKQGVIIDTIQYPPLNNYNATCNSGIATEYGYALSGFTNNGTIAQGYLLQITPNGAIIDTFLVGQSSVNGFYTLCRTPDGGYMLGGSVRQATGGGFTIYPYLIRLNEQGGLVWDRAYTLPLWGGVNTKITTVIADTLTDTYYVIGRINASNSEGDVVWAHIDGVDGSVLSYQKFGNEQPFTDERTSNMIRTSDGGWLFSYTIYQSGDCISGRLVKLNATGDTILWNKEIFPWGGTSNFIELADGSFIVGSQASPLPIFTYNATIAHVSADGDSVYWQRSYGGANPDYIYDFTPTSDGGYFFVGRTESNLPNGGANVYLLKTNCMGLLTEPQAQFSYTPNNETGSIEFQNLSQFVYPDSIDGGHYLWHFGDGTTATSLNPTHQYLQNGVYLAQLTAIVCSDTSVAYQSICIGVSPHPAPAFSYTLQNDTLVSFINTSSNAQGGIFTWHFGDGSPPVQTIDATVPQQHAYTQSGQHSVTLSVVLCGDTTNYTQTVTTYAVGIASPLPPPKEGELQGLFSITPNPANSEAQLNYNLPDKQTATLLLYDVNGKLIVSNNFVGNGTYTLHTNDLASSIYFYTIVSNGEILMRNKLVIIK